MVTPSNREMAGFVSPDGSKGKLTNPQHFCWKTRYLPVGKAVLGGGIHQLGG